MKNVRKQNGRNGSEASFAKNGLVITNSNVGKGLAGGEVLCNGNDDASPHSGGDHSAKGKVVSPHSGSDNKGKVVKQGKDDQNSKKTDSAADNTNVVVESVSKKKIKIKKSRNSKAAERYRDGTLSDF